MTQLNEELLEENDSNKSSKQIDDEAKESGHDDAVLSDISESIILICVLKLEVIEPQHCIMPRCACSQISPVRCTVRGYRRLKTDLVSPTRLIVQNKIGLRRVRVDGMVLQFTSHQQLNIAKLIDIQFIPCIIVKEETNCISVLLVSVCRVNVAHRREEMLTAQFKSCQWRFWQEAQIVTSRLGSVEYECCQGLQVFRGQEMMKSVTIITFGYQFT